MKYKLIVFDIDGTITTHISSWRYIHEKLNLWDVLAHKYQDKFLAGKISYRRFCELDAAHWKGIEERKIRGLFKDVPYAKNASVSIKNLKKKGFKLAALSTGLQFMTDRVKNELDFDYTLCNILLTRNGILTGKVKINITHGAKGKALKAIQQRFKVKPYETICVGDTAGDIPLAKHSGFSIAFNSSSKEFSDTVDYSCRTKDFKEVYNKILQIAKK